MLDLGATICKPRQPLCEQCPINPDCLALQLHKVDEFPKAKPKKQPPVKTGHFLWINHAGGLLLQKRPAPGIWAALWCLPEIDSPPEQAELHGSFSHQFTHYKLEAKIWRCALTSAHQVQERLEVQEGPAECLIKAEAMNQIALPAPIRNYLQANLLAETASNGSC